MRRCGAEIVHAVLSSSTPAHQIPKLGGTRMQIRGVIGAH